MTRNPSYDLFIQGAVWRALRTKRLKLDNYHCRKCNAQESLHVHHRTYIRFGGDELLSDLVTLCESCHDRLHAMHKSHRYLSLEIISSKFLGEHIRKHRGQLRDPLVTVGIQGAARPYGINYPNRTHPLESSELACNAST